jgi:hypothetical protein
MRFDYMARILAVAGIIVNGVTFTYMVLVWFDNLFVRFVLSLWFLIVLNLIFALVLPVVGYALIRPVTRSAAAAILIVSGLVFVMISYVGYFGALFGGALVALGGGLAAAWQPFISQE